MPWLILCVIFSMSTFKQRFFCWSVPSCLIPKEIFSSDKELNDRCRTFPTRELHIYRLKNDIVTPSAVPYYVTTYHLSFYEKLSETNRLFHFNWSTESKSTYVHNYMKQAHYFILTEVLKQAPHDWGMSTQKKKKNFLWVLMSS